MAGRHLLAAVCALSLAPSAVFAANQQENVFEFKKWCVNCRLTGGKRPTVKVLSHRLIENGATIAGVDLFVSSTGYGIQATETLMQNSIFVDIPVALVLNERNALGSEIGAVLSEIQEKFRHLGAHSAQMMCILSVYMLLRAIYAHAMKAGTRTRR